LKEGFLAGCSSPSLSLLDSAAAALLLLLAPERLRFGTSRPEELGVFLLFLVHNELGYTA
jgi:hypothetical protein